MTTIPRAPERGMPSPTRSLATIAATTTSLSARRTRQRRLQLCRGASNALSEHAAAVQHAAAVPGPSQARGDEEGERKLKLSIVQKLLAEAQEDSLAQSAALVLQTTKKEPLAAALRIGAALPWPPVGKHLKARQWPRGLAAVTAPNTIRGSAGCKGSAVKNAVANLYGGEEPDGVATVDPYGGSAAARAGALERVNTTCSSAVVLHRALLQCCRARWQNSNSQ